MKSDALYGVFCQIHEKSEVGLVEEQLIDHPDHLHMLGAKLMNRPQAWQQKQQCPRQHTEADVCIAVLLADDPVAAFVRVVDDMQFPVQTAAKEPVAQQQPH